MYYYQLIIKYNGSQFKGFQFQPGLPTIQSTLNHALRKILSGKLSTRAASRTDTGVHANNQVVRLSCEQRILNEEDESDASFFLAGLNAELAPHIVCTSITKSHALFSPNSQSTAKEYRYFFTNKKIMSYDSLDFLANFSRDLDINKIQQCLDLLIGEHDFCNFSSSGSNVTNTLRSLSACEISSVNPHTIFQDSELFAFPPEIEHCFQLRFVGKGFLKQMIRHIVSALWMVGSGKISVEEFQELLKSQKKPQHLWKVAPASGLFLFKIDF